MEQRIYFEDLPAGETVRFEARYPVTAEEIVEFAAAFDPQPMHLSEEAGKASILGGLAASGWHTCAMAMRLMSDGYIDRALAMGSPGIDELKWLKPVRPGDTLHMERTCLAARRLKSRPGVGVCTFRWVVYNQADEPVIDMVGAQMFFSREHAQAEGRA
jgi:acyl dehydratase